MEKALAEERQEGWLVLIPIRLDDTVFDVQAGWASFLKNDRHIGDFSGWTDPARYRQSFQRLLRDLKAAA